MLLWLRNKTVTGVFLHVAQNDAAPQQDGTDNEKTDTGILAYPGQTKAGMLLRVV
jgi:hypothetical protein